MQIWSSEKSAFVDFADGYSYLPGLPVLFGISREPISHIKLSTVMHEFTHQLALKGPFGWLCAYFQALRYLCRRASQLQTALEQASPENQAVFAKVPQARDGWDVSVFYNEYSDVVSNFKDLLSCYRPLLEGMALYTQFDFVPSRTYDVESELYRFLFELYNTEWRYRVKNLATKEDIEAEAEKRKTATETRTEADDQATKEYVYALFDEIKNAGFTNGLLKLVMESTTTDTAPYFCGYLIIKQIQRLLADKDPRLADAEVYFIFMQSYLFYDRRLVNLCSVDSRLTYQQHVLTFLCQSIAELVNANPEHVSRAIDSITNYTKAAIDYASLDFAAAVRDGEIASWKDSALLEHCSKQIQVRIQSIDQRFLTFEHPKLDEFTRELWTAGQRTIELFHELRQIMLSFKLRHTERASLDFTWNGRDPWVTMLSAEPGVSYFYSRISLEEFVALEDDIKSGSFTFAHNDDRLVPLYDKEVFYQTLSQYYKEEKGKLLILQDYDLYLMMGKERFRVWIRGDFLHVEPVPLGSAATLQQTRSQDDLSVLRSIGSMFYHGEYLPLIQIPEFRDRPLVPSDIDFERKIYMALWPLVYPQTSALEEDLVKFMHQKARLIAAPGAGRTLLHTLFSNQRTEIDQEARSVIQSINRNWKHHTGRDLITLSEDATPQIAQLQI